MRIQNHASAAHPDHVEVRRRRSSRGHPTSGRRLGQPIDSAADRDSPARRFDRDSDDSYNRMNPVDSPDEAILDESVAGEFRRQFRRFLSHVTYYQQTGGLHEQVATAPLGGVTIHGRSQRVARSQDRRRGVHRADGHPDRHVVFPVLGLFVGRRPAGQSAKEDLNTAKKAPERCPQPVRGHAEQDRHQGRGVRPGQGRDQPPTSRRSTSGSTTSTNAVNAAVAEGPGEAAPGAGAGGHPGQDPAGRSQSLPQRAQQDLYLVARPAHRADGEPVAPDAPSCRSTTSTCGTASSRRPTSPRQQVDVQTKAAEASHADLDGRAEEARRRAADPRDQGRPSSRPTNDQKPTEIANLDAKIKQQEDDFAREKDTLTTIIRELRDQARAGQETILDHPDGYVTYVDYERREVLVNINRRHGRPPADEDDDLRRRTRPASPPRSPRGPSS